MTRRVFYSFHYEADAWRVGQVRNIGMIEGNEPTNDNDWEMIVNDGDAQIERWIDEQMEGRTCIVVLVGSCTAERPWVKREIEKAWNRRMGVVGIHIHGLTDQDGNLSHPGDNPFDLIKINETTWLSCIAKCYDPPGSSSAERYGWIKKNLSDKVEEAIEICNDYD